jgi:hypothetical protein
MKMRYRNLSLVLALLLALSLAFGQSTGGGHQDLIRYTVGGINIKNTGATAVLTTGAGAGNFHITQALLEVTAANTLTVGATLSVGTNSSTWNNIVPATVLGTAANQMTPLPPAALTLSVAPSTLINANISIAAIGVSGTASVTLIGFYQ